MRRDTPSGTDRAGQKHPKRLNHFAHLSTKIAANQLVSTSSHQQKHRKCHRLTPPPISAVPTHAITGFRVHRLGPPQTTRNCASGRKPKALPKARQGKCCVPQLTNFKPRWRRVSTRQLIKALPRLVLRLSAPPLQRSASVQRHATTLQPVMPAEHHTAQGKASARAASRSIPTSSHAGGGSPHAS